MGAQFCSLGHGPDIMMNIIKHEDAANWFDKGEFRRSHSSDEQHVLEAARMIAADRGNCRYESTALIPTLFEMQQAPLQDPPNTYFAVHRNTGVVRRLVTLRKPRGAKPQERLRATVRQLQMLRNEGVARILEVFEDCRSMSLVTEHCSGGTVYDRILQRQYFAEQESAVLVRHVLQSLAALHCVGLAHGYPTPDSFRFQSDKPHASLKLVDFGLEYKVHVWEGSELQTVCPPFLETCRVVFCAPELARPAQSGSGGTPRREGKAAPLDGELWTTESDDGPSEQASVHSELVPADVWSVGAIAFLLLCGYPPFYAPCRQSILARIAKTDYAFDPPFWSKISEDAKDFVQRCLRATPSRRLTAAEALQHPWIQSLADASPSGSMLASFGLNLRRFYRTALIEVFAANSLAAKLSTHEMQQLYGRCCEVDASRSGFVTATDLRQILMCFGHSELAEALGMCSTQMLRHPGESYVDYAALAESVRLRRERLFEEEFWRLFREFAGDGDDPAGASSTGQLPLAKLAGFLQEPSVQRLFEEGGAADGAALMEGVQACVGSGEGACVPASAAFASAAAVDFADLTAAVLRQLPAPRQSPASPAAASLPLSPATSARGGFRA